MPCNPPNEDSRVDAETGYCSAYVERREGREWLVVPSAEDEPGAVVLDELVAWLRRTGRGAQDFFSSGSGASIGSFTASRAALLVFTRSASSAQRAAIRR